MPTIVTAIAIAAGFWYSHRTDCESCRRRRNHR